MFFKRAKRRSNSAREVLVLFLILVFLAITSPFVLTSDFIVVGNSAQAFNFHQSLDAIAYKVGLGLSSGGGGLPEIIGGMIYGILGLLGVFFLILVIIAGFRWMTGGGNEETVAQAKKSLANAIIGVVIILSAYAITFFVLDVIL